MSAEPGRRDVIVIGAGAAGLTAANALSRAGRTVLVHEARDRVGGRVRSVATSRGTVDVGATWFWPDEPLVESLAEQLGLGVFAQHRDGDALFETMQPGVQRLDGNPIDVAAFRFAGGAQALAQRLADQLPPGTLRLEDPVTAVAVTSAGVRVDARGGSTLGDHVVIAVPPALAVEQITFTPELPADLRGTAERTAVWMGGTVKAVAVYDDAFWRAAGLSGSAISYAGPFREFHDHSGPEAAPAAIFAFAPAQRFARSDGSAVERAFRDQLTRMLGRQADHAREIHVVDWSRERFTVPRHPAYRTSTDTFGAAVFQQPVHDRVHWASTETATAYAGHIEGAVRAGLSAAKTIARTMRGERR